MNSGLNVLDQGVEFLSLGNLCFHTTTTVDIVDNEAYWSTKLCRTYVIEWELLDEQKFHRNVFLLKQKWLFSRLYRYTCLTLYAMDRMWHVLFIKFLYLIPPVSNLLYGCWIHHNVYGDLQSAKYSIIKSPYFVAVYHMLVKNTLCVKILCIYSSLTSYRKIIMANDGHYTVNECGTSIYCAKKAILL